MQSFEPGEDWIFCYVDKVIVEPHWVGRSAVVAGGGAGVAETVAREELKAKMDRGKGVVLMAALGPEHYRSSHLPGAVNFT